MLPTSAWSHAAYLTGLLLLVVVAVAALDGFWGWLFPLVVLITAGPIGALIGEWVVLRRSQAHARLIHPDFVATHNAARAADVPTIQQQHRERQ